MKKIVFIALSAFAFFVFSCKKTTINKRIVGEWTVKEMTVDGNPINLDDTLRNTDSLDITSIRQITFNGCDKYELNDQKYCYGHMRGMYFTYDQYEKNNVASGIVFPFVYEVKKGGKILFKVDYGTLPNISSKVEKEFEVNVKEKKKNKFVLEYTTADGKTIVISLEK
ncbi:MAG: hypothetical protein KatS3mg034_0249 [Vicingaceae bacterium]|nr:MAG: hypothetical protein KatS3mg034_0249 [Vicingaceae bacterium]